MSLLLMTHPVLIANPMNASQDVLIMTTVLMAMFAIPTMCVRMEVVSAPMIPTVMDMMRSVMLPMITASSVVMAAIVLPQMDVAKVAMIVI